jgi:hypothetical protein
MFLPKLPLLLLLLLLLVVLMIKAVRSFEMSYQRLHSATSYEIAIFKFISVCKSKQSGISFCCYSDGLKCLRDHLLHILYCSILLHSGTGIVGVLQRETKEWDDGNQN